MSNLEPISVPSLQLYLDKLTTRVERHVSAALPNKFALVFGGWTHQSSHYVGIFASHSSVAEHGYDTALLGNTLLENEVTLGALKNFKRIEFVPSVFSKTKDGVVALIGDSVSTNKALSNEMGVPSVGYASHRFNLAVLEVIATDSEVVAKVHAIMSKLRNTILAAR